MKQEIEIHNNILYAFREHERAGVITVTKQEEKEKYLVYLLKDDKLVCSCPGFLYRSYCWHTTFIEATHKHWEPINEPWAEWAEDAMVMRMSRKETT